LKKIVALKRQQKDCQKQGKRQDTSQFPDPTQIEHCAYLKTVYKQRDSALRVFYFLLFIELFANVHHSPFPLILLRFLAEPIYHRVKGFSSY
jgi:hypothetical protein